MRKCIGLNLMIISAFLFAFVLSLPAIAGTPEGSLSHEGYTLEQVVVLSRHNIRSPLSGGGSVLGMITPHEWFSWS